MQPPPAIVTKRRTREHIIASLSENYVQRLFLERGHTCDRLVSDYGYDFLVATYSTEGYAEGGPMYLQVKATDDIEKFSVGDSFSYTIDIASYNQWREEPVPVYFILFDAQKRRAFWANAQVYLRDLAKRKNPKETLQSVQIHVSRKNVMNLRAIDKIQKDKNAMKKRPREVRTHEV